jgi:hypothetical protein
MTDKERLEHYETLLMQILQPLGEVPFELFIKAISGKRIIPINANDKLDLMLISRLEFVAKRALLELNKIGIDTKRPNEAGNKAELFVKSALEESSFRLQNFSQSAGYPDILIFDDSERPTYLEVKTFNIKTKDSTLRSFFVSPPKKKSKIEFDAHHLIIAFQLERRKEKLYAEKVSVYDIAFLMGEVKQEFNTSNKELYAGKFSKELFSVTA